MAPTKVPSNLVTPALNEFEREFSIEKIAAITMKNGYCSFKRSDRSTLINTAIAVLKFLFPIINFVMIPPELRNVF